MTITFLFPVSSVNAADFIQRVFDASDGLANTPINDIYFDHYGYTWLATEHGLYRITNNSLRRIDKVGSESVLTERRLRLLHSVDKDHILMTSDTRLFLYNIREHTFTEIFDSTAEVGPATMVQEGLGIAAIEHFDQQHLTLLGHQGKRYLFNINDKSLTVHPEGELNDQLSWVSQLHVADGGFLYASSETLQWHQPMGEVIDFDWHITGIAIKGLMQDSTGRIWLYTTKGLFHVDLERRQIELISVLPYYIEDLAEDKNGNLWAGSRSGLFLWNPNSDQLINYQHDLKLYANIDYIHALSIDNNGLIWIGGSGDGLAVAATPPEFLLDTVSQLPPYSLTNEMIWAIFERDEKLWVGTDAGVALVDPINKTSVQLLPDDLELSDSVYQIAALDDDHISLLTTNGLFYINTVTLETGRFHEWSGGQNSLEKKSILQSYHDPAIEGRIWFLTSEGIYFWQQGADDLQQLSFGEGNEPITDSRFTIIIRDDKSRLWVSSQKTFGYFDDNQQYISKSQIFDNLSAIPKLHNITQVSEDKFWIGTSQHGILEFNSATDNVLDLDAEWQIDCSSALFFQTLPDAYLIGCSNSIIWVDKQTLSRKTFTQHDGFISGEFNEAAVFYQPDKGVYIGTPDGVMLIDPKRLVNRVSNDQAFLESVSIYYDDQTDLYLIPEQFKTISPGANLISFQISNLNYIDNNPMSLKYRFQKAGDNPSPYVVLEGQSQINVAGLRAGDYTLEILSKNRSMWSSTPFTYHFSVDEYWWQSQLFRGIAIFIALFIAISISLIRQQQVNRFKKVNQALIDSDDRLSQALKGSDSDLWEWHNKTQLLRLNNRGGVLGSESLIISKLSELPIHEEDKDRVTKAWLDLLKAKSSMIDVEYRYLHESGKWRWLRVRGRAVAWQSSSGHLESAAGIYSDITAHRELENEVHLFAEAFKNTSEGMLILDVDKKIILTNNAANSILGFTDEELKGQSFSKLLISSNVPLNIDKLFTKASFWSGERALLKVDDLPCPVWLNISKMNAAESSVQHYVVVFSDITERKQNEKKLQRLANTDALTGVANRSQLLVTLNKVITEASAKHEKLALLFLDLDRFKSVNDSYGHSMGDALLVEATNRLQSCLESEHVLCRFGGDEFVILLRHVEGIEYINHVANSLLKQIEKPFKLYGREFFISTSIGISCWPEDCDDPETLIKNADLAMYHAKDEGRGNFQYYSAERNAQALYHLRLESDLRKAIENNGFTLHYQPQVDVLNHEKFVGMEALLRWNHPQDGYIRPDIFVEVAESCGLIIDIDRWVLKQACVDGARWHRLYGDDFKLSVNVSAVQFSQTDFIEFVQQTIEDAQLPAKNLCLEITEGVLMSELHVATQYLSKLKQLGIQVAIDDFGTGYSSLAYLRSFEVNSLKIDRSFLIDIADNQADQAIVSSIIELARNLKLQVVAEGIETEKQLEQVFSRGCYIIQGYYFAKPMPRDELDRFLGIPAEKKLI
ncbi:EAL domain-containing protein [Shewanella gaetbuli]